MKKDVLMTTCRCEKHKDDLVMTRGYLNDLMRYTEQNTKTAVLDEVLAILQTKRDINFHQSLTAGSATFWKNRVTIIEQIMNEIEEIKCR